MSKQTYEKALTSNDLGRTGAHQAGIHIPKSEKGLLDFLPQLNSGEKNPDVWLECLDDAGAMWRFRFIHYNNKLHEKGGTRDEYRITHMTKFFRTVEAQIGDLLVISGAPSQHRYSISIRKVVVEQDSKLESIRIRLKGWRRVH